jgi:pimeloyl-ACP methyl ester carboxylesterase
VSARSEFPPLGTFVDAGGTRLHYVERGSGPAVVLLHGNPGSLHHFLAALDGLAQARRVLAFDRPGHGWSEPGTGDMGSPVVQARLVREALRALEVERPVLVAESWSGALALAFALEFPGELAAVVSAQGPFYEPRELAQPLFRLLLAPLVGPAVCRAAVPLVRRRVRRGIETAYAPAPVPSAAARRAEVLFPRPGALRATARDSVRRAEVVRELAPRYREVTVPVVLLVGTADSHVDQAEQAYRLHRELPSSELVEVPETGHALAETRPQAIVDAVLGGGF